MKDTGKTVCTMERDALFGTKVGCTKGSGNRERSREKVNIITRMVINTRARCTRESVTVSG